MTMERARNGNKMPNEIDLLEMAVPYDHANCEKWNVDAKQSGGNKDYLRNKRGETNRSEEDKNRWKRFYSISSVALLFAFFLLFLLEHFLFFFSGSLLYCLLSSWLSLTSLAIFLFWQSHAALILVRDIVISRARQ